MAPRTGPRVKIVSPNSGIATYSRSNSAVSSSVHSSYLVPDDDGDNNDAGNSTVRFPLRSVDGNRRVASNSTNKSNKSGDSRPRQQQHDAADKDAIQRAQSALSGFSGHVLRQPFGRYAASSCITTTAVKKEGAEAVLSVPPPLRGGKHALQLPDASTFRREDSEASSVSATSSRARARRQRSHSNGGSELCGLDESEGRQPLQRRRVAPTTSASDSAEPSYTALFASFSRGGGGLPSASQKEIRSSHGTQSAAQSSVCPGMFKGLSALTLSDGMFSCVKDSNNYTGGAAIEQHAAATARQPPCSARSVSRPLWSLVGTYKTALTSIVDLDFSQGTIKWTQRSPRGGYQTLRIPMESVLDILVSRVEQEDEDIREAQYTVIIRTSARPSQVVFGFRKMAEANQLRQALRRIVRAS